LNYTNHVVTLKKGLKLARIEDWDTIGAIQEFRDPTVAKLQPNSGIRNSDVELEKFHKQYGFKICPHSPPSVAPLIGLKVRLTQRPQGQLLKLGN